MKQFTLPLAISQDSRPIVRLTGLYSFDALLDTGATIPVWVRDEKLLQALGGIKISENFTFSGFGGETQGTLYRIPAFTVGELTFPHLPVVVAKMNAPFYMILSASMFSRLRYEIDDFGHKLNITIPPGESFVRNIAIRDENGRIRIVLANEKE